MPDNVIGGLRFLAVEAAYAAMIARLRQSIGPTVGETNDAQNEQLEGVVRMLAPQSALEEEPANTTIPEPFHTTHRSVHRPVD